MSSNKIADETIINQITLNEKDIVKKIKSSKQ